MVPPSPPFPPPAGKSKRGELSIFPTAMSLLAPCLHMLPKDKKKQAATKAGVRPSACAVGMIDAQKGL